jgi:hypothetical protein
MNTTCQGCGAKVSQAYVRVFAINEDEGVETCPAPDCTKVRRNGLADDHTDPSETRHAGATNQHTDPVTYDPTYGMEAESDD